MDRDIIEKNTEQGKPAPDPVELLRRIRAYYKTTISWDELFEDEVLEVLGNADPA